MEMTVTDDGPGFLSAKVLFLKRNESDVTHLIKNLMRIGIFSLSSEIPPASISLVVDEHISGAGEYDQRRSALFFRVKCLSWERALLRMVRNFESRCCNERSLGGEETPILQLTDSRFFGIDCISAHLSVPVRSISFGNFMNSASFLSHFQRSDNCDEVNATQILSIIHRRPIRNAMFADFEHDRDLLTVNFVIRDGRSRWNSRANSNSSAIQHSAIVVKMYYSTVHRIVIDLNVPSDVDQIRCTKIYFQLGSPVEIRKIRLGSNVNEMLQSIRVRSFPENDDRGLKNCVAINESPFVCLELKPNLQEYQLYQLLCRLHARIGLPLEFTRIDCKYFSVDWYVTSPVQLMKVTSPFMAPSTHSWLDGNNNRGFGAGIDSRCATALKERNDFALEYFIAALISRGAIVKDQLLITEHARDTFIDAVLTRYDRNKEVTIEALERLLNKFDERREPPELLPTFESIFAKLRLEADQLVKLREQDQSNGYRRVRRVVITPTRMLLIVPELMMANRVLRSHDECGDRALRVQFRDDNGARMTFNAVGPYLIDSNVRNVMMYGIYIAGRHFVYLASSNSQMRENGCYFFDESDGQQVQEIRNKLGIFDRSNIPKLMARIGQCFTQSMESKVLLTHKRYNKTFDIIGGNNSSMETYTFSDGCGKISPEFARKISRDLDLSNCVPSCFQIRFRGIKGVLSVDPWFTERAEWAIENGIRESTESYNRKNMLHILFRPSQDKFHAPLSNKIEIVKYSNPTPVTLNRPLIVILDQVGAMQGYQVHTRINDRICSLLDRQLVNMIESLMSEDKCRERLMELPRRINIDDLSLQRGFALTEEPFFRSLLRASVDFTIKKRLSKAQIQIPTNLARAMFGVVDETGILQDGQVFIQYTNYVSKMPHWNAPKSIVKGRVLITKNPQILGGDARVFDAIDVFELRHLVDVVVFPQYGPRPHPDQMAGSDLDGDEYGVIWDEKLLFDYNEEASDFTKPPRLPDDVPEHEVVPAMVKFFVDFIKQDSIGSISNAFMVNADLYGINSQVCLNIAKKHSQSVDFSKTGLAPIPLLRTWTYNDDGLCLPPEKAERWPDFMNKTHEPVYRSPRLVGHLFRQIRLFDDVHTLSTAYENHDIIHIDKDLLYEGRKRYRVEAEAQCSSYSAHIAALLDNYGIEDEGQLLSSHITNIHSSLSEREMDRVSLYNAVHVIEMKVNHIFARFRKDFFEEFGGYIENTEPVQFQRHSDEPLTSNSQRVCTNPSPKMKMKASAYYEACYSAAQSAVHGKRILSFPWVVWDILASIKQAAGCQTISIDPLTERLSKTINRFCEHNEQEMGIFMEQMCFLESVKRYCRKFIGLDKLMFFAYRWADKQEIFDCHLRVEHLCLLLIQYGLGLHATSYASSNCIFLDSDKLTDEHCRVNLNDRMGGLGKCFIGFLQFLSSRNFKNLKVINFQRPNLYYHSILLRGQWFELHRAAVKLFYRLVLTGRFEEPDKEMGDVLNYREEILLREMVPFVIELPEDVAGEDGLIRNQVLISAVGTIESLQRLRNIVAIQPPLNTNMNSKTLSEMIGRLVYERISSLND